MTQFAFLIGGMLLGALALWGAMRMSRRRDGGLVDMAALRWERTDRVAGVVQPALRDLRRCYPTHDIVANHPFLSLADPLGVKAEQAERRCRHWTVGAAMVDKRSGRTGRILLWSDDPDAGEKAWILRRVGYKVAVVDPVATGDTLQEALVG